MEEGRQRPAAAGEEKNGSVIYPLSKQASPVVREEDFAKQLRIARYLAGASLPPTRPLEAASVAKTPKQGPGVTKAAPKAKAEPVGHKAGQAELAKERRRAGQVGRQKAPSSGERRSDKQRSGPGR